MGAVQQPSLTNPHLLRSAAVVLGVVIVNCRLLWLRTPVNTKAAQDLAPIAQRPLAAARMAPLPAQVAAGARRCANQQILRFEAPKESCPRNIH